MRSKSRYAVNARCAVEHPGIPPGSTPPPSTTSTSGSHCEAPSAIVRGALHHGRREEVRAVRGLARGAQQRRAVVQHDPRHVERARGGRSQRGRAHERGRGHQHRRRGPHHRGRARAADVVPRGRGRSCESRDQTSSSTSDTSHAMREDTCAAPPFRAHMLHHANRAPQRPRPPSCERNEPPMPDPTETNPLLHLAPPIPLTACSPSTWRPP